MKSFKEMFPLAVLHREEGGGGGGGGGGGAQFHKNFEAIFQELAIQEDGIIHSKDGQKVKNSRIPS